MRIGDYEIQCDSNQWTLLEHGIGKRKSKDNPDKIEEYARVVTLGYHLKLASLLDQLFDVIMKKKLDSNETYQGLSGLIKLVSDSRDEIKRIGGVLSENRKQSLKSMIKKKVESE